MDGRPKRTAAAKASYVQYADDSDDDLIDSDLEERALACTRRASNGIEESSDSSQSDFEARALSRCRGGPISHSDSEDVEVSF